MIDFPNTPTPGVTTLTQGRKTWLCVDVGADGKGVWDLVSTPDAAAAQVLDALNMRTVVPATATSAGTVGQWAADVSYLYVCVATNVWRRTAIVAW